jgi:uncharacterized protein (DUF4415 family)
MILRENTRDVVMRRHKSNEDGFQGKSITIRIDEKTLNDFKAACGEKSYQCVIKDLMREYIYKQEYIYKEEERINKRMLR